MKGCERCGGAISHTHDDRGECPCSWWIYYEEGGWYWMGRKPAKEESNG